jgi:hypothetical protein
LGTQMAAPFCEELLLVPTKDIGDFQTGCHHFCPPSSSEWWRGLTFRVSKGLWMDCRRCRETRRYFAVVRISPWPNRT